MKKRLLILPIIITILIFGSIFLFKTFRQNSIITGAPPYGEAESAISDLDPMDWITDWVRPDGPTKVALQVGHWKNEQVPEELKNLRGNIGAIGGGKIEWEVNHAIAEETKRILEEKGVLVEILSATVPPKYYADVFVAIHADGHTDLNKSGYKASSPWRDFSGKADKLVESIERSYQRVTGLKKDNNITRNMRGYYAFSWWRYKHAVHPMATSAIMETGFLTTASDRRLIVDQPEVAAKGIAEGILEYLKVEKLI